MKRFQYLFIGFLLISLLSYFDVGQSDFVFYAVADPLSAVIGGGASLLSSLFGGLFGSSAQESANQTNLQIARETNNQNYSMFHEQQNWNEKMYRRQLQDAIGLRDEERAYNTPEQIAQRLRNAGINPSAILGSSAGSLSSNFSPNVPSVQGASPNPAIAARVEPYDYSPMMEGISRSINSYFENQNQDLDARKKKVELLFEYEKQEQALLSMKKDNERKGIDNASLNEQLDILRKSKADFIRKNKFDADLQEQAINVTKEEISLKKSAKIAQDLQADILRLQKDVQQKYGDKQAAAQLRSTWQMGSAAAAAAYRDVQAGKLSIEQAKAVVEKRYQDYIKFISDEAAKQDASHMMSLQIATMQRAYNDYVPYLDPVLRRIEDAAGLIIPIAAFQFGKMRGSGSIKSGVQNASRPGFGKNFNYNPYDANNFQY